MVHARTWPFWKPPTFTPMCSATTTTSSAGRVAWLRAHGDADPPGTRRISEHDAVRRRRHDPGHRAGRLSGAGQADRLRRRNWRCTGRWMRSAMTEARSATTSSTTACRFLSQVTGTPMNVDGVDARRAGPHFPLVLANVFSARDGKPIFRPGPWSAKPSKPYAVDGSKLEGAAEDRHHRLHAAADHAVGQAQSRRQGHRQRRGRSGPRIRARTAGATRRT